MEKTRKTFLILDDDPGDIELLRRHLGGIEEWDVEVLPCPEWTSACAVLKRPDLDAILVDFRLGGTNGLEVLKAVRDSGDVRPFLFLTAFGDETVATEAMRAGADDYLSKHSLSAENLRRALGNAMAQFQLRREKALLVEELRQSQRMEAIGHLAGGLAHDFNNMLAGIMGRLDLALSRNSLPEATPDLEKAQGICGQMSGTLRSLLSFARKGEDEFGDLNLGQVLGDLRTLLEHTLPKRLKVAWELTETPLIIRGNASGLQQVLQGLANNAAEAMGEGGGSLRFRLSQAVLGAGDGLAHPGLAPGPHAILEVSDDGRGMDAATLARVFDPFFSTKGRGTERGTGMSLALAWQFVRNLGGSLTVASEPGRGATFTLRLPLKEMAIEPKPAQVLSKPRPALPGGTETLLLVDDEDTLLEVTSHMLHALGYTTLTASDGVRALETFETMKDEIAAVVLDLSMPRMDGRECLKGLLNLDPHVRVLFASGHDMARLAPELMALGAKGVLQKPLGLGDMARSLRAVLDA